MFTKAFWKKTAERAVATAAEAALAALTVDGVIERVDLDLAHIASIAGLAAVAAVLKGIVASYTGDPESPSFVDEPGEHSADR